MIGKIDRARHARSLVLAATAALLLMDGTALAQLAGMNGGSPSLGVPGIAAPAVAGTGIPFGATELGTGGLSPLPLGAIPFGSSMTGALGTAGLGTTGMAMPGIAGSTSLLGNGLSPGVMPPGYTVPSPGGGPLLPGITNYGIGGMQRLPGSPSTQSGLPAQ
jgi:hypothetical protein